MSDYKQTLNLPKTQFSMRANLKEKEPKILEEWEDERIYRLIRRQRAGREKFILHDGPPYANGNIHMGHALNKILKDIIIKFKTMMGFDAPYVPGWDCHGLPIEHKVVEELGEKKNEISKSKLRSMCREYADKYVNIQREEFKKIGVFGDWANPYLTMNYKYEAAIVRSFGDLVSTGYIFKGLKPVYWCMHCQTALAEAEVEYKDLPSHSIFVKFRVKGGLPSRLESENVFVIIWTTTPWTLPANMGVCFHPDHKYTAVKISDEYYIMADELIDPFLEKIEKKASEKTSLNHDEVFSLKLEHPFFDRESSVVFNSYVTMDIGSGCVHIAPGHGIEDYEIGLENGLKIVSPVNAAGVFTEEAGEFEGIDVFTANKKIIEKMKEKGTLLYDEEISHSYPVCWRCKEPVIFRATEQWFFKLEHKDLRDKSIEHIERVNWIPEWGEERIRNMFQARTDWCLSRQRVWGVPIPALNCSECGQTIMDKNIIYKFAEIVKEKGTDSWFDMDVSEIVGSYSQCPNCGSKDLQKENDILDVWFDSGVSHFAVLEARSELGTPADVYLEGSDQYRGWFQSSLWPSVALRDKPPYKTVITHGFMLDETGKAMHKSAGNAISPQEIMQKYGADILRLWTISLDYTDDMKLGDDILNRLVESYRLIRNTLRFLLGNVIWIRQAQKLPNSKLQEFDQWALIKLKKFLDRVTEAYNKYEFHVIYHQLNNFCAVELSSLYLNILKDKLYTFNKERSESISSRTVLAKLIEVITKIIAPVLSFTSEEVWKNYCEENQLKYESIHLQDWPVVDLEGIDVEKVERKFDSLFEIRGYVTKLIELAREKKVLNDSLESKIYIIPKNDSIKKLLEDCINILNEVFIVSQVEIIDSARSGLAEIDVEGYKLQIEKTSGRKCSRCWNYSDNVGQNEKHPDICNRCIENIEFID